MTLLSFNQRELKTLGFGAAIADKYYSTLSAGEGQSVVKGFNAATAYNQVAYAFRCVMLRAQEISRVPRALLDEAGNDVTDRPEYKSLMVTDDLLMKLEISRCVYGQAYAVPRANANGFNLGLEWAASPSITPWYSPITSKVERFDRNTGSRPIHLTLDQIVYLWNINIADENKPGPGETMVALSAESMLWALDAFAAGFFNSGAVKVTVFPVDPATQKADVDNFQNFLNRRLSGVMNAFRNIVMRVRGELKPVVIGSDLKDTLAVELTQEKKQDIAHAHGIPPNVVDGTYKYATADSEYLNFVTGTIIPRTDQTFEVMNAQFYRRYGLKLVSQADKMEIMQTAQLAQSQSLMQLTGGKALMTVKQACEWLGIKPEILIEQGLALACPYCDAINMLSTAKCTECGAPLPMQARPIPIDSNRPIPIDSKPVPVDAMINKPVAVKALPEPTHDEIVKGLTDWRKAWLESLKHSDRVSYALPESLKRVPKELQDAILDDGFYNAKSVTASTVRAAFEKHWPKPPAKDEPTEGERLIEALAEATKALEAVR